MFTGIITHTGKLNNKRGSVFTFTADKLFCKKLKNGFSVAVNGVCLTICDQPLVNSFSVQIMPETQKRTTFKNLQLNHLVNLELPITIKTFLSGHLVQGHIDTIAKVKKITIEKNSRILKINLPAKLNSYVVEKGSICINGISLTIIGVNASFFTVGIIPYTWKHTMLNKMQVNDFVNIEVDIIAKYLKKLLTK